MRSSSLIVSIAAVATLAASQGAHAAMLWDESVNGDFSNSGAAPTALTLGIGSNQILGTTGNAGQGVDLDYFTFTLAPGQTLTSITVLANTFVSGQFSFIGIQPGPQVTVSPSGAGAQALLGWAHYGMPDIGTDLLASQISPGVPLTAGAYSVWVQDTGGPATYGFDFSTVQAVPLPPSLLLMASSLFGFGFLRRRTVG